MGTILHAYDEIQLLAQAIDGCFISCLCKKDKFIQTRLQSRL